jgi:hypothetical protein
MRWGKKTVKGYWRHPTVGLPAIVRGEPVAEAPTVDPETLAPQLEQLTRLALEKMTQILKIPTDRDGNLLRAQTAVASAAVNAQLRADETRMKQVRGKDIMERLLAMLAEEKAKMAEEKRLEREGKEGLVGARTDIVEPSAEDSGITTIMPARDTDD